MALLEGISTDPLRAGGGARWTRVPAARTLALLGALLAALVGAPGEAAPSAQDDPPLELESLAAEFAAMPGLSARFREEKHLALLQEPLVSRGVLYFARPRRLVRHMHEPVASTLLVQGEQIAFSGAHGIRTLDLAESPTLLALVDSIRLLLAGDVEALRESFRVEFESAGDSDERAWEIRLEPLPPPVREVIASIAIAGRGRTPLELRVVETGGDETLTRFSEVDTDRRFSDDELAEFFRVPAP